MSFFRKLIPGMLRRFLGRLRFPTLFVLTGLLFGVNVFVPDAIPFVDEILLGLGALMLGRLRERTEDDEDAEPAGSRSERVGPGNGDPDRPVSGA